MDMKGREGDSDDVQLLVLRGCVRGIVWGPLVKGGHQVGL